jgi:hypothetical protein
MSQLSKGTPDRKLFFKYKGDLYYVEARNKCGYEAEAFDIIAGVFVKTNKIRKEDHWTEVFLHKVQTGDSIKCYDYRQLDPTDMYSVLLSTLSSFIGAIEPWAEADWPTLEVTGIDHIRTLLNQAGVKYESNS